MNIVARTVRAMPARTPVHTPTIKRFHVLRLAAIGIAWVTALAACTTQGNQVRPPEFDRHRSVAADHGKAAPGGSAATAQASPDAARARGLRTSFNVDAGRGNPQVLTYMALSGGGSRAAYFSAATMLQMQSVFDDIDLLAEVDVLSGVSGGALAAAYYVGSRDSEYVDPALAARLGRSALPARLAAKLQVQSSRITCQGPLNAEELRLLTRAAGPISVQRLQAHCADRTLTTLREWNEPTVRERMRHNFLLPWMARWFLPTNFVPYWLGMTDRSDIMADVLASNLYSHGTLNTPQRMADLNPYRPYLLINATNATQREPGGTYEADDLPFGSVFTFTDEDFARRLNSRIDDYPLARAVMASAAFPVVFQTMTLTDHREGHKRRCLGPVSVDEPCSEARYLHVFDGGNSDNLGLHSVKRSILEQFVAGADPQAIVVWLVDAITRPRGADPLKANPRTLASYLADLNVTDAVDSLLKRNHDRAIEAFATHELNWSADCAPSSLNLPASLCARLSDHSQAEFDRFLDRLTFVYIGFEGVEVAARLHGSTTVTTAAALKAKADDIPTSFALSRTDAATLDAITRAVVDPGNPCMQALRTLYRSATPGDAVPAARKACMAMAPLRPDLTARPDMPPVVAPIGTPAPAPEALPENGAAAPSPMDEPAG
jgi:predicted acylesterase/phospholipase RssA